MNLFGPRVTPPSVWAVEDTAVQICWGDLPAGAVTASAGVARAEAVHEGGAGAIDLHGLAPGRQVDIELRWSGGRTTLSTRTVETPPGPLLTRFATISDLHLGATTWGALRTMVDDSDHPVPHPYRCAAAAIAEARNWGAELLIIKGDAADHECEPHFDELGRLVDEHPDLAMFLLPGNHDVDGRPGGIPVSVGKRELAFVRHADHLDLPGVRIVGGDTTVAGQGPGSLDRAGSAILELAAAADRPVFVTIHQQLQTTRYPRSWPAGIAAPESTRFLDRLDGIDRPVFVSSGHTHRNRSRTHGATMVTEVASTKDWPGVWAGYAVHEGGIRQVVRRIAAPAAIAWTEYSRGALHGLWGRWAVGGLGERCLTQPWTGTV
jgi:3',5'-cyclic-AMP phosphodiesterase